MQLFARALATCRRTNDPVQVGSLARRGGDLRNPLIDTIQKTGFIQQITRVIAGERELRKNDQLCVVGLRFARSILHQYNIARDIACRRVDLRQSDSKCCHVQASEG